MFPEILDIDKPPHLFNTLLTAPSGKTIRTPVYSAGWTLTIGEIYRKYRPKTGVMNVGTELRKRWKMLEFDKKYNHPYVSIL